MCICFEPPQMCPAVFVPFLLNKAATARVSLSVATSVQVTQHRLVLSSPLWSILHVNILHVNMKGVNL